MHCLNIATGKSAPGVQVFISHLPRWLCTRPFREPSFRHRGTTKHWKKQSFATSLPARLHLLSESFSSDLLSPDSFSSLTLLSLTSAFLFVQICPVVTSLTPNFSSIHGIMLIPPRLMTDVCQGRVGGSTAEESNLWVCLMNSPRSEHFARHVLPWLKPSTSTGTC